MTANAGYDPQKSGGKLPNLGWARGSLHVEWKRCGKEKCGCAKGRLHGPYYYRHWRERGRQKKAYVPRDKVADVQAAIDWRRVLQPPAWEMRQELAELRRLEMAVSDR